MKKYTFSVTRLSYSAPVTVTASSEEEANQQIENLLLSDAVDFDLDNSDFSYEIFSVEDLNLSNYTPMSAVASVEEDDDDVDEENDSTYVPMSALKPVETNTDNLNLDTSLKLLGTIETLAEQISYLTDKVSELELLNLQLRNLSRKN